MERKQGNTIVASRTLKNGQGAFAYLGLSLSECEPKWMSNEGGGDLAPIQKVLSKRKTPQERQNCVNFFDVLLQSIRNELQGVFDKTLQTIKNEKMLQRFSISRWTSRRKWGRRQLPGEHDRRPSREKRIHMLRKHGRQREKDGASESTTRKSHQNPTTGSSFVPP